MTQPEFATVAGTSKQYVNRLEKQPTINPNPLYIEKWARRFGVRIEWIITGKEPKFESVTPRPADRASEPGTAYSAPCEAYKTASDRTRAAIDLLLLPARERRSFGPKVHGAIDTLEDEAQIVLAARKSPPAAASAAPRMVGR